MSDLIVLAFPNEADVLKLRDKLLEWQQQHLIQLTDAAFAVRGLDGKMNMKQVGRLVADGDSQGLLIGFVFWMSWLGLTGSAAANAPSKVLGYIGVADKFITEVSRIIISGHSVLLLLVTNVTEAKVMDQLQNFNNATVLKTSLSKEDEALLKEAFGR